MLKKLAITTIVLAIVVGLGGAIARSESDPADAGVTVSDAVESVDSLTPIHGLQPIGDTVALWRSRSEAQPLDYLSRSQLGVALSTQARETADLDLHADAEAAFGEALAINDRYLPARLGLAGALLSQHRFGEARAEAARVRHAEPDSLSALALVGDADLELGNYAEAGTAYRALVAAERSAPTLSRLARLSYAEGDPARAKSLAAEALADSDDQALRPATAAFYRFQLGHYQFASGAVDEAIESYRSALALESEQPAAAEALAFALASTGQLPEAARHYDRLVDRSPAADIHGLYADVLRALDRPAEADVQERLGAALAEATGEDHPAERRHLVGFHLTRNPQLAVELATADAATRSDVWAFDTLAWALHHAGRSAEAAEVLQQAPSLGTRDAALSYHAGAIAAANGDRGRAQTLIAEGLAINPNFHPSEAADARALLQTLRSQP